MKANRCLSVLMAVFLVLGLVACGRISSSDIQSKNNEDRDVSNSSFEEESQQSDAESDKSEEASSAVSEEAKYSVTYLDAYGNPDITIEVDSLEQVAEIRGEDVNVDGRMRYFYSWDMVTDGQNITVSPIYYETLEKTVMLLTNEDVFQTGFSLTEKNGILVVYISFTDGYTVDPEVFEDRFIGDYEGRDSFRSVSAYYREDVGANDLFEFSFYYYDCPMSCEEAWHWVNDEDSSGRFRGNEFLMDIFTEIRSTTDLKDLDKNGDGYVDAVLFVCGDRLVDNQLLYGGAMGTTDPWYYPPDSNSPNIRKFIKLEDYYVSGRTEPGVGNFMGTRVPIHEIGHLMGLSDYYDFYPYNGETIDSLGTFDMQSYDMGGWNPFSKLSCGFLSPYVITPDIEDITLKLSVSPGENEAVLIPTSLGFNGTPYDEYILIDVLAPFGANGFDWSDIKDHQHRENDKGGVRIYHVDARLVARSQQGYNESCITVDDLMAIDLSQETLSYRFYNTNGLEPLIDGDSRFYHIIDIIPSDGTSKYRISTPTERSAFTCFTTADLFGKGDVFSTATHSDSFANGETMNNGGTLDYTVTVVDYDEETGTAIINIHRNLI